MDQLSNLPKFNKTFLYLFSYIFIYYFYHYYFLQATKAKNRVEESANAPPDLASTNQTATD